MTFLHNTFRNQGIRATTILPGETNTPIMDNRAPAAARKRARRDGRPARRRARRAAVRTLHKGADDPRTAHLPDLACATLGRHRDSRWIGAPDGTPDKPKMTERTCHERSQTARTPVKRRSDHHAQAAPRRRRGWRSGWSSSAPTRSSSTASMALEFRGCAHHGTGCSRRRRRRHRAARIHTSDQS